MLRRAGFARTPYTAVAVATLAVILAAGGMVADGAAAAGPQSVTARLAYACRSTTGSHSPGTPTPGTHSRSGPQSPAGSEPVMMTAQATFPASATAGQPARATGARLTLAIPAAVAASLAARGPAVSGSATLSVGVTSAGVGVTHPRAALAGTAPAGTAPVRADWAGLTVAPTHIPDHGGLTLTASGPVPAVTPRSPGSITESAGNLLIKLTIAAPFHRTSGPPPAPVLVQLACTPKAGQGTTLVSMPVAAAKPAAKHHRRVARPRRHRQFCPPQRKGQLKLNPKFPLPKPPKKAKLVKSPFDPGCAFLVGFADVRKLKEAALVGPGIADFSLSLKQWVINATRHNDGYFQEDSAAQLDFKVCHAGKCHFEHALPPAHATFLGFGFVPVSATIQLDEVGTINIVSLGTAFALKTNTVWTDLVLRVSNVKVNGVHLPVGPNCGAGTQANPLLLKLTGVPNSRPPYSLQLGGPLTGDVTIPDFHSCGVTENLDPLFTGSISGPRNFNLITQGAICTTNPVFGCPPKVPKPLRSVREP